jgi:hypothetical protein
LGFLSGGSFLVDIGGVVDHHCLDVGSFVDIGGVVDHHCLEVGSFVDIGEVVDHHRLNFLVIKE